jgi:hypothetical protein
VREHAGVWCKAALCPVDPRRRRAYGDLAEQGPRAAKANQPVRRKKQRGEECGDLPERLEAADLTGPAAQNTMGAEVSGTLRRTPSRPSAERGGLDGVGAPRLAPAANLSEPFRASRVRWRVRRRFTRELAVIAGAR